MKDCLELRCILSSGSFATDSAREEGRKSGMLNVDKNTCHPGNTNSKSWSGQSWEATIEWQTREVRLLFRVRHIPLNTKTKAD